MKRARKRQEFWAVHENNVVKVTGFSCDKPDDIWWCPSLGWSGSVGFELFDTEHEAIFKALTKIQTQINDLELAAIKLKHRNVKLKS